MFSARPWQRKSAPWLLFNNIKSNTTSRLASDAVTESAEHRLPAWKVGNLRPGLVEPMTYKMYVGYKSVYANIIHLYSPPRYYYYYYCFATVLLLFNPL